MKYEDYIDYLDNDSLEIHISDTSLLEKEVIRPILLITHELTRTGAPIQLMHLTQALAEIGYQPFVVSPQGGDLLPDFLEYNIVLINMNGIPAKMQWLDKLAELFDVAFANTLVVHPYIEYLSPKMKCLFWWIHENSYFYLQRYCANIPSTPSLHILAASKKTEEHIKRYMGIDSQVFDVCIKDYGYENRKQHEKTKFLWAGTLDPNKSVETLVESILDLHSEYADRAEYYIYAKKDLNNEYTTLLNNLSQNIPYVHFEDRVSNDRLIDIMSDMDAVVVVSHEETTSMVAVEGLMRNRILICSDGCGVTKYLEDGKNALIFKAGDHEELNLKIKQVIESSDEMDLLSQEGRKVYESQYSYDTFVKNLQRLLQDACIINGNMNACCGCGACSLSCPMHAISMVKNDKGFLYPVVDLEKCVHCGKCRTVCQVNNPMIQTDDKLNIFAYKIAGNEKRMESQSGGAFTALAENVLSDGGIVYGVALNEENVAQYIEVTNMTELKKIKGSKYVQAEVGDIYVKVKKALNENRTVLFGGTSCHVAGLFNYLGDAKLDNLYTCDLVCHGVPSPEVFSKYLEYRKHERGSLANFNFRDKSIAGWHEHIETWKGNDNNIEISKDYTDLFYTHIAMRENCYQCQYASFKKPADITIGDFWGIEKVMPEIDDNKGVSLVIARSVKGKELVAKITESGQIYNVSKESCIQNNLVKPTDRPSDISAFWDDFKRKPFKALYQKYVINRYLRMNEQLFNIISDGNAGVLRILKYTDNAKLYVNAICGDRKLVELYIDKIKALNLTTPLVIDVFDESREYLEKESFKAGDYALFNSEDRGKILVLDIDSCEETMYELVRNGVDAGDILPISFIFGEEV